MFWKEDSENKKEFVVPQDVVDISFALACKSLPLDHAWALSHAIQAVIPWFADEELAGLHLIHVAESGNGWLRPEDPENELLYLSQRTRMTLRVPQHRIADTHTLTDQVLDIDGHTLTIKHGKLRPLSPLPTLFCRYVISDDAQNETQFLQYCADSLAVMEIPVTKMMAGKQHKLRMEQGYIYTRSLMVAELSADHAVRLQQLGIGEGRKYGCGLFIPQKGIKAVNADD